MYAESMAYQPVQSWEWKFKGERRGVAAFRDTVLFWTHAVGQPTDDLGIYVRRKIRGVMGRLGIGNASLHAVGRAWDCKVPDARRNPDLGNALMFKAAAAADQLGICEIIFNRKRWTKEGGTEKYTGVNGHYDHVHFGFTIAMADNGATHADLVKWFGHFMFDLPIK